jgi:hypothetical protein
MNRIAVQFLDQGLHRVLFEAMPMPVFVVNEDVSILECNAAAVRLFGPDKQTVIKRGSVALCARGEDAGRMWSRARLPRLPGAQGGAGCFPRPARDAPKGANGTGCREQDNQGGFADKLQSVHVRTMHFHLAGPRRLERLRLQNNV